MAPRGDDGPPGFAAILNRLAALIQGWNSSLHSQNANGNRPNQNGTRNTHSYQFNGVRRLPLLRLPNGAHNPGVRLSNGAHSPPPLLSPKKLKEDLKAKEDDTKPSLSPASDKANSPTWSITKMSHLDEEEAEDTKSTLSEKILGDTYKPLEEIEWPSCFPAPPSSPSNTSSLPSHDYLHEISPSPPPDFKHEASPSPPSSVHNASTLPISGRHREPIPPVPTPELPSHILCPNGFQGTSKTMTISRTRRKSHNGKTSPNHPRRLSLQTTKSSSPQGEYQWIYINDLQKSSSSISRSPVEQHYHSPSPPSPQSVITLSPAKLQCDNYYSPNLCQSIPPSSPSIQMTSTPSPVAFHHSSSSSSSTSQLESSVSIVYNASPSPPLQNFSDNISPEPSIRQDVQSGSPQSTPKSASLDEITVHRCSMSPPNSKEPSPVSEREGHEGQQSLPPTPPPLPEFFEEDIGPTPPPIPKFFETESPSASPVQRLHPIPVLDEEEHYDNVPPPEIPPNFNRPRMIQPQPLYVIQESPSPHSSFETKQESPTAQPSLVHKDSHTPKPTEVLLSNSSKPSSPTGQCKGEETPSCEEEDIVSSPKREKTPSPPPPPPIEVVHENPPSPKDESPQSSPKQTSKEDTRPASPEFFNLPDNWPEYPPFLFGDSDFPPP